ncbi:MAG: peptidoglycan bridge formation glycyltransferase FemA/FemB family protein [bacterium]|nr:peptidoglycan bridge formation glycyltransferase FemA/FemB family protein [bacterium]
MTVREIRDKGAWEGFLEACREKTFLQSWNWGEFQELMRGKVWRFMVYAKEDPVAAALVVKVGARRGTFLLVPHGPVTKEGETRKEEILSSLHAALKDLAKQEGASFLRLNPIWERNQENERMFLEAGFRQAPIQIHSESSWKLDITLGEEELLSNMRKTTRYLVRQAEKNGDITVRKSREMRDIETFQRMHEKVSLRQAFVPFSLEYLRNEFAAFSKDDAVLLFVAEYQGKAAAASFVVFWGGIGFYHHAASLPEYAKLSLPYLLQWEAIREAKSRGCRLYDFWGYIDPKTQPGHPWAGSTFFKMGFGGRAHLYLKTKDYPVNWKYWPTALFETVRKMRRRL